MGWRRRIVRALAATAETVAALCLAFMMLMTVADVTLRAIDPAWRIFGMLDYVEFSLDWMIFLAIAVTMLTRAWVAVDLIDNLLAGTARALLRLIGLAIALAATVLMGLQTITPGLEALEWGDRTLDLGLPKFWYWLAIWVGLGLAAIGALLVAPDEFAEGRRRRPRPACGEGA